MRNSHASARIQTSSFRLRAAFAVAAFAALAACAPAATYYVSPTGSDSNVGTIDKPFANLYRATSKTLPGDVVYLRGGTYAFTCPQTVQGTGSSLAQLTVSSYPGETAVLDFSGSTAGRDGLQIAGKYVTVMNLTVQNSPKSNVSAWGASYVKIKNIKSTGSWAAGILVGATNPGGAHDIEVSGCDVSNCVRVNAGLSASQWQPGIQTYQCDAVTVANNNVHQNYGEGIGFCTTTGSKVTGNQVWDNFSVNIYLDNVDSVSVTSNFVYGTGDTRFFRGTRGASGISLCVEGVTNPIGLRNVEISNNTITNCFAGIWYSGFGLGGGLQNCNISRNTIYKTTGGALLWIDADTRHVGNLIQGNVFQQAGSNGLCTISSTTGLGLGNNCWYGGNAGLGVQATDLLTNPLLLRPGSYSLADYMLSETSPCISKGIGTVQATSSTSI
jgi:hypothetical protein